MKNKTPKRQNSEEPKLPRPKKQNFKATNIGSDKHRKQETSEAIGNRSNKLPTSIGSDKNQKRQTSEERNLRSDKHRKKKTSEATNIGRDKQNQQNIGSGIHRNRQTQPNENCQFNPLAPARTLKYGFSKKSCWYFFGPNIFISYQIFEI